MDLIAEYRLYLKYPTGERVALRLRMPQPRRRATGVWECDGEIEGTSKLPSASSIGPDPRPVGGPASTSWQALMFAVHGMYRYVRREIDAGAAFYDESGRYPIHLDELFPWLRSGDSTLPDPS